MSGELQGVPQPVMQASKALVPQYLLALSGEKWCGREDTLGAAGCRRPRHKHIKFNNLPEAQLPDAARRCRKSQVKCGANCGAEGNGMGRARHKLSAPKVRNTEVGTLYDGGGLQLEKTSRNSGKWIYRYSHLLRRRDMGLGPYPSIGLAEARVARDHWESVKNSGRDPINVREEEQVRKKIQQNGYDPIFDDAIESCLKHNAAKLKKGGVHHWTPT